MEARDEPLAAGTVIDGRYRVIAELGAGGMGRVYEAEHMFIRRRMALKLLRGGGGGEAAARMVQEATLAGQVPHAAVVRVFDCAALADGQVYVAMELLRGESLEQALARGIDAATAFAVLAEVARGLAAVHRVGVVHRDIKPANIFLCRDGAAVQAKLLDFGVAKALPGASELAAGAVRTQAGAVLGTPYYVAPEQIRGGAIDGRADLYGVGVMLYEALTGSLPFVGDSLVAILAQHARVAAVDPRQAAPERGVPDEAARLTMRLLEKDPDARPADGDALAEAIAGVLAREGAALANITSGGQVARARAEEATRVGEVASQATVQVAGAASEATRAGEVASQATVQVGGVAGDATVQSGGVASRATVQIGGAAGDATERVSDGSGAGLRATEGGSGVRVRVADATSSATAWSGDAADRGASRAGDAASSGARRAGAASATRMAEGTGEPGGRGTWALGGLAAVFGVVAVVWFAGGGSGRQTAPAVEVRAEPASAGEPVVRPAGAAKKAVEEAPGAAKKAVEEAPGAAKKAVEEAPGAATKTVEEAPGAATKTVDAGPAAPSVEASPAAATATKTAGKDPRAGGAGGANKGTKKPRDGGTTRPAGKTPPKVGDDPPLKPDVYGND
ncbi:MAG: protein kinase [Myxococcales bacterium]|nr:protein kinase [Myxococcales bacterium]